MEDLRKKIVDVLRSPNNKNRHPYRSIAENIRQEKADELLCLITAQNDAIYAKVMELLPKNNCVCDDLGTDKCDLLWSHDNDLRQSIDKIFGKADAKPAGEGA